MSSELQSAKAVVRAYQASFDTCENDVLVETLQAHTSVDYFWRGMHPFHEQSGPDAVVSAFWAPLRASFSHLQRREDVFMAGFNDVDGDDALWVTSMGHMLGLFDHDWLSIPATRRINMLPYAEFHRVADGKIAESAFFCDIIRVMQQAGLHPLPPQTGAALINPAPLTHDGLLDEIQDPAESHKTMNVVKRMANILLDLNNSGDERCPPSLLAESWHENMAWYGPAGIGATFTIERYQEQHQYPFRLNLKDKIFNGHVARFAEGNYAGFFGWPNLTNTPTGGFLGLPASNTKADMRVVDIYRREGDKLAENWVFIDLLHWLAMQGVDVLSRLRKQRGYD